MNFSFFISMLKLMYLDNIDGNMGCRPQGLQLISNGYSQSKDSSALAVPMKRWLHHAKTEG
jgi:hypothetical protein